MDVADLAALAVAAVNCMDSIDWDLVGRFLDLFAGD